jgi:hypothetical protein
MCLKHTKHIKLNVPCHLHTCVIVAVRKVRFLPTLILFCKNDRHVRYQGHWIQDCPTNNDREYDNRPRIKRTTGIPRSFLKTVENAKNGQVAQGVMITPEGGLVVAQPDTYVASILFFKQACLAV